MTTRETFKRNMRVLAATFPDRSPTAETSAAYWMALSDLCDCVFEQAVQIAIRECRFYPRPSEIRERARRCGCAMLEADGEGPPTRADRDRLALFGYELCERADALPEPGHRQLASVSEGDDIGHEADRPADAVGGSSSSSSDVSRGA